MKHRRKRQTEDNFWDFGPDKTKEDRIMSLISEICLSIIDHKIDGDLKKLEEAQRALKALLDAYPEVVDGIEVAWNKYLT